jgi:hypothetical protein
MNMKKKTFSGHQTPRQFITCRLALKERLKRFLHREGKLSQMAAQRNEGKDEGENVVTD